MTTPMSTRRHTSRPLPEDLSDEHPNEVPNEPSQIAPRIRTRLEELPNDDPNEFRPGLHQDRPPKTRVVRTHDVANGLRQCLPFFSHVARLRTMAPQ